jgi:hypothetical protein
MKLKLIEEDCSKRSGRIEFSTGSLESAVCEWYNKTVKKKYHD